MAKVKISEFSANPASNTDIDGINLAEGCAPSGINDAIRELMAQLKDFQAGTAGDSFNGPVGTTTAAAGAFTTLTTSSTVTHNGGTANGVAYLNGSKVLTTGSALTFDGSTFGTTASLVDVNGVSLYPTLRFRSSSNTSTTFVVGRELGASFFTNSGNSPFYWSIDGSEQMRLTSTGLGIGTSSPGARLDIVGATSNQIRVGTATSEHYRIGRNASDGFLDFYGSQTGYQGYRFGGIDGTWATINSSGNLGLGVTPSAWDGNWNAMQFGAGGALAGYKFDRGTVFGANFYNNGGWKYRSNGYATQFNCQDSGIFAWYTAPSGTAGNAISFSQAMTLDASGNLMVGQTSADGKLTIGQTAGSTAIAFVDTTNSKTNYLNINNGQWQFWIPGPTQAMTLDASGNLLVGYTATPSGGTKTTNIISTQGLSVNNNGGVYNNGVFQVNGDGNTSNTAGTFYQGTASAIAHIQFQNSNGIVGSITTAGSATLYNATSDYRLKTVIGPVANAGQRIDALEPIEYEWKSDGSRTRGFLAHKFQEVYAGSVTGSKDAVDAEGNPVYQAMQASSSEVIADLVAEIQSLRQRLAAAGI